MIEEELILIGDFNERVGNNTVKYGDIWDIFGEAENNNEISLMEI